ncbi:hypothetical protein GQ43DRAFT_121245 [Delitschia confertaspora ATCC 74209]|uniref:Secreted protein n=1 Tax=Delitschia confertaspora ATCC 74209 TaxID=1513339 RepID=A0A9P4MYZ5_9PLEO|nr:hypothetical protein GQ43DRAFT_121245 [Delitschia confertaspora ATCC 74209]
MTHLKGRSNGFLGLGTMLACMQHACTVPPRCVSSCLLGTERAPFRHILPTSSNMRPGRSWEAWSGH